MSAYEVAFERIGRDRDIEPQTFAAEDLDDLLEQIYKFGRPYLRSRDVDVWMNDESMTGGFVAGFHNAGNFTVTVK